jgi:hypothetical protein
MNYPESALLTGLISAINTKLPGRSVYTIPPKDSEYPYILINQTDMRETGSKGGFIYSFEPLIQVIYKDVSSLVGLLSDMQEIHEIVKNGDDITVSGYTTLRVELISTNRTTELYDWGRLDIGLIRLFIEIF